MNYKNYAGVCTKVALALALILTVFTAQAQVTGGIGAQLIIDSSEGYTLPYIKSIIPLSPAALFLGPGQFILAADGTSCRDKSINDVVALIRGIPGTEVKLKVSVNKNGKDAKEVSLTRVQIEVPKAKTPDATLTFSAKCDEVVRKARKQGHRIVREYNSECGSFYFNFNADTGYYYVAMLTGYTGSADSTKPTEERARLFDDKNEAGAQWLADGDQWKTADFVIKEQTGALHFAKPGVGVINTRLEDEGSKKCKSFYILIYH